MSTNIVAEHIVPTSRLVASVTGFPVQPNKAIVGANAFAHESGIHQDGVLKHRETYEIMRAEDVGWNTNKIILGKHSGRAAVKARFEALGITFDSPDALNLAFAAFKELADKKHEIFDEDLHSIVSTTSHAARQEHYGLQSMAVTCKTGQAPTATLELIVRGEVASVESSGSGPVDAAFKAIERQVASGADLLLYSVNAITKGTDSQGEVTVRLERDGRIVNGVGSDTDIVTASVKAYLSALNLLESPAGSVHPQLDGV